MIMKNQLLNLKMIALMCLMMVLGGANVWAEDVTLLTADYTWNADASKSVSQTVSGVTFSFVGGTTKPTYYPKNGLRLYEGCKVSISSDDDISQIVFTYTVSNYGVLNDVTLGSWNDSKKTWTGSAKSVSLTVGHSSGSNNGQVRLTKIVVTKAQSKTLTSLAISGEPSKKTYEVGEEFDPTGLVVTGTYDDKSTATITDGITWTKNPKTLSLGDVACSVIASVGEVKSESYVVNGLNVVRTISLSIDPTTSTVVKAPVNVTLTATEGATVYYTTNGDEPTTNSDIYKGPFEVTHSGTTVKALAVAEGAENVTAEATYTIQPEQPVFSDESKTFKDAFNVTLSLPESTDATSKIYYEIGGTATAESKLYEDPITISAEKDGEKVILHAVVVDQYGNVGKEKFCTYTKTNAIVFDFTANPNAWGIKPLHSNTIGKTNEIAGKELPMDGVVMTATSGTSNATCIYDTPNLRVYNGGSITFTAPEGYNLSEISFTGDKFSDKSGKKLNATEKELTISKASSATWTGNAHAVTFNAIASVQFETATIKLVAVEPVKPTFGTLDFKAHDGDGFHYATFSSDKDVVFNQKSVDVFAVSVSNEKVDMNPLADASYNVTDATVGSIEKGYYVPANTGVLIVGYDATTTYYFPAEAHTVTLPANQLKPAPANGGVFEATTGYKYYKLAYDDFDNKTGLGFYWGAPEGGKFFVKAGTAYLAVPAGDATAKGFAFNGEATGIEGVNAIVENAKAIYNLNGQRVASMAKPGLYIVNGKKMVVRK